jgi:ABC-type arginine transport system permease subunit
MMMEAVSTSETSVNFYGTTRRKIPETVIFIVIFFILSTLVSLAVGFL